MRAVVYQHEDFEDLARLAPALKEAGFGATKRFRSAQHDDVDAELVVVLGGSMGAAEFELHPFLRDEQAILSERLAVGRPCLGICLGAQLLAAAAGAEVFPGKNGFEVGAAPVRWTKEALADPVVAGVNPRTVVGHWHRDTFKAVPGATLLASTERYTQQAFRLGPSFGFQFHPELGAEELGQWLTRGAEALAGAGKDVSALKAQLPRLKAAEAELSDLLTRLANHFARCAGR